ncbi:MAG TPA: SCP2 sterol-binding domain-containing protein [Blastocatellia bacterium]|nr:SCP2 sterol-binding domain-containing protein [Blastocatellia bacterium]
MAQIAELTAGHEAELTLDFSYSFGGAPTGQALNEGWNEINSSRNQQPLLGQNVINATWLRQICLDQGADDVGFVEIDRPELDDQPSDILAVFPKAQTLISIVCRMNRENIRSSARSVANLEFHHANDGLNETARNIVRELERIGVRAINPAVGFPMEMDRFPKGWVVSHKPVAVAAGLGQMGIHRNVIHPKFGNFILLDTVITDARVGAYSREIDYNPCVECKLCVAACPVGAIGSDGYFNFSACLTHNYREFMTGFNEWVGTVVDSKDSSEYRKAVSSAETASIWQSLSFGANYKAAYCMAVCPAGEEVISPFKSDRKAFLDDVVRPLQAKQETIYVIPGSDAEEHVARRFPNKKVKQTKGGVGAGSVRQFLKGLPLVFQPGKSEKVEATFQFRFTGEETLDAVVVIRNRRVTVAEGQVDHPDVTVAADSRSWVRFLGKEIGLPRAILTGKIRIRGNFRLMRTFAKCFPG